MCIIFPKWGHTLHAGRTLQKAAECAPGLDGVVSLGRESPRATLSTGPPGCAWWGAVPGRQQERLAPVPAGWCCPRPPPSAREVSSSFGSRGFSLTFCRAVGSSTNYQLLPVETSLPFVEWLFLLA